MARRLFDWAGATGYVWFGSGKRSGSFGLAVEVDGKDRYVFAAYTYGAVEVYLQWLRYAPPFDDESKRRDLMGRLNAIEGVSLPLGKLHGRPSVKFAALAPPGRLQRFTEVLGWAVAELRGAGGPRG